MPFKFEKTTGKLSPNSCSALYMQLARRVKEQIAEGALVRDEKLPGMGELAKLFGVSLITVDSALKLLIEEGVCYRRPKKGTFVGAASASSLSETSRRRLVLVYSAAGNLEFDSVMKPFLSALHSRTRHFEGADIMLLSGHGFEERLESFRRAGDVDLAGVVVVGPLEPLRQVVERNPSLRFVLLNFQYPDFSALTPENVYGVFNDEFCGGYSAANWLLGRGARRVGVIHYHVDDLNYKLRIDGFLRAHEDLGLLPDAALIRDVGDMMDLPPRERAFAAMKEFLSLEKPPDAVFCLNDLLAAGAAACLKSLAPNSGVMIMGFDNLVPDISFNMGFDTVMINSELMARCAIDALLDRRRRPGKQLFIAPQLLARSQSPKNALFDSKGEQS